MERNIRIALILLVIIVVILLVRWLMTPCTINSEFFTNGNQNSNMSTSDSTESPSLVALQQQLLDASTSPGYNCNNLYQSTGAYCVATRDNVNFCHNVGIDVETQQPWHLIEGAIDCDNEICANAKRLCTGAPTCKTVIDDCIRVY